MRCWARWCSRPRARPIRTRATRRSGSTHRPSGAPWVSWSSAGTRTASPCCATRRFGKGEPGPVWEQYELSEQEWQDRFGEFNKRMRSMLSLDPPDHTRLRKLVAKAFTPRTVEKLRPDIVRLTDELLDRFDGVVDVIPELALQLPIRVIGEMLGVPQEERDALQPLVRAAVATLELQPVARGDGRRHGRVPRDRRAVRGPDRAPARAPHRRPAVRAHPRRGGGRPARPRGAPGDGDAPVRRRLRDHHQPHRQRAARPPAASRPDAAAAGRPFAAPERGRGAPAVGQPGAARWAQGLRGRSSSRASWSRRARR